MPNIINIITIITRINIFVLIKIINRMNINMGPLKRLIGSLIFFSYIGKEEMA